MSYIRSTENPEGLYIYQTGTCVHICPPYSSGLKDFHVPANDFQKVLHRWDDGEDNIQIGDIRVTEVFVPCKKEPTKIQKLLGFRPGDFKIKFSYKKRSIHMWLVTWDCIVQHGTWGTRWDYVSNFKRKLKKKLEKINLDKKHD